jgi:4-alpha-glucanotransferase
MFHLDDAGMPTVIAGVPPDYFSATGQRWGSPLYRWKRLAHRGYPWWTDRMRATLTRFDAVRLDHFIGFQRYWEIPAGEPTAVKGRWMKGPGAPFFAALRAELGELPLIAEDLGAVTRAVKNLRDRFQLPGIKILQFAFGNDPNADDFLPHNYARRAVVYTGTHDNDTTQGWFREAPPSGAGAQASTRTAAQVETERAAVMRYLGVRDPREIHWDMIRAAQASVARLAIVPLQDALGLGAEGRMNRPGTASGNWEWRFVQGAVTRAIEERLASFAETYDRTGTEGDQGS